MGEFINGLVGNLIASVTSIITVKLLVKNNNKSDSDEKIAHAAEHAVIERRLNDQDIKFDKIEEKVYVELKEIRQLVMQLLTEGK